MLPASEHSPSWAVLMYALPGSQLMLRKVHSFMYVFPFVAQMGA